MQHHFYISRRGIVAACTAFAALAVGGGATAQTARNAAPWQPTKPINFVVSVAPGSSVDMVARLLADQLAPALGQPVVVVNRPGASGLIAASSVARADPDGLTIMIGSNTMLGAPHTMPKGAGSGVDVLRDITPIIIPATSPMVVLAHPSFGAKTPKEMVERLKAKPGQPYATAGQGSPFHFAGEMFMAATGTVMTHTPYRGVMPAVIDTVAGQVPLTFGALGGVTQFIESGKLIAIATGEKQRTPLLPDVPTFREAGIPLDFTLFFPVFAPAKTPPAIIERLNREMGAIMKQPETRARLLAAGVEARSSTVEEARAMVNEQYRVFGRLAAEYKITSE
ncbi:tripartite tricarboxylate transporter substrate binding protein [Hydrogenophaga sp.]|uniref:Bug family tripartite tricarboxylate transporter substrate binding protein n=1 Tax=Hydrogenophaga sp. TaxID=1904254 RepID=UPI002718E073|nr:tripartite tricarboxylate transporter substrate-binding protein [Hydrogenophaga sp.]MDO9437639.1 tripartite tricarboxylate transporter substrate-binding protein [Hydrogenophaga sp.]